MRQDRIIQASIFDLFSEHEIGRELKAMSAWLDAHREVIALVAAELCRPGLKPTGRDGLPAESVLRCALLKQYRQLSYQELAFHLSDSASFRAFARLPLHWCPKKSVLQETISAISARTWERINRCLLASASETKVETGTLLRLDSTVTETMIHEPSDSWLLCDAMRIMVRLLDAAGDLPQVPAIAWHNHSRRAKRRAQAIDHCRKQTKRTMLYRDLIAVAGSTVGYLRAAAARVSAAACAGIEVEAWLASVGSWLPLVEQVIEQTERRVLKGETVPAAEKLVSLFEPHSDIIVKGGRDVHYGHKLNLTSGKSGMILDVVIEAGNPADAERLLPMLERHIDIYGRPPRQMAADGGYASGGNLKAAKEKGVRDMAFHKKRGLKIEDMVRSRWVYRKLRNFRAGIEAGISCLKQWAYGLARCTWKGLAHFKAYAGPRWWPTTWRSSHASSRHSPAHNRARYKTGRRPALDHVRILPRTPTATTTYYHVQKILPRSNQPRTRRLWPAQDPGKTPRLWRTLGTVVCAPGPGRPLWSAKPAS